MRCRMMPGRVCATCAPPRLMGGDGSGGGVGGVRVDPPHTLRPLTATTKQPPPTVHQPPPAASHQQASARGGAVPLHEGSAVRAGQARTEGRGRRVGLVDWFGFGWLSWFGLFGLDCFWGGGQANANASLPEGHGCVGDANRAGQRTRQHTWKTGWFELVA